MKTYYLECHVTIEPLFGKELEDLKTIAKAHGFKVADLITKKTVDGEEVPSSKDSFMTAHAVPEDMAGLVERMAGLIDEVSFAGYEVYRYKIENVTVDSRQEDVFNLL